jgi:hypothetical protein
MYAIIGTRAPIRYLWEYLITSFRLKAGLQTLIAKRSSLFRNG